MSDSILLSNMSNLADGESRVANIIDGAHNGLGINPAMLDTATPLIFPPVNIIVLKTPVMYQANDPNMGKCIKALMESHAKTVTGIDISYTLDTAESQVGHDGQTYKAPTNTKRSPVEPSFTFDELQGNIVWEIFYKWITDIQDPDTNFANPGFDADDLANNWVASTYAATFLAIQYDPTGRADKIINAGYYSNVFPLVTGDLGMERTLAQSNQRERSINFSAHLTHNKQVITIARELAKKLQLHTANLGGLSPTPTDVDTAIEESGVQHELDQIAASS